MCVPPGTTAGPVVKPILPLMVVPALVLVYVLASSVYTEAEPSEGVVAADALRTPIRPTTTTIPKAECLRKKGLIIPAVPLLPQNYYRYIY